MTLTQRTPHPAKGEVSARWFVVDAQGKVLGRLASAVATVLRGKHKPLWSPHVDVGDHVVVINAERVHLTGTKPKQKVYRWHTGYIGNLREVPVQRMLDSHPERVIEWAVSGMLPKTKLGRAMFRKLKVYRGGDHPHQSQAPETLEILPGGRIKIEGNS